MAPMKREEASMAKTLSEIRDELADREAIRDVLYRYARGTDRVDEDMLRSAYWPEAVDEHLEFSGTREEFIAYSTPILRAMRYNMHMIGNILISIDGNKADVETYYHGYHTVNHDGVGRDVFAGGRYLDNFERRGQEWRIIKRFVTVDWFRELADTADWVKGPFGMKVERGALKPEDKSYALLKLLERLA
jgi:SnoaL-like domain